MVSLRKASKKMIHISSNAHVNVPYILNDNYHYKIFIIGYFISFNLFIQFVFYIFIENDSHKHAF